MLQRFGLQILVAAVLAVCVLALPVIIPVVHFLEKRDHQNRQKVAARFQCEACGTVLGLDALHRADTVCTEEWAKRKQERPGVRYRLRPRDLWAICTACGADYNYDPERHIFFRRKGPSRQSNSS